MVSSTSEAPMLPRIAPDTDKPSSTNRTIRSNLAIQRPALMSEACKRNVESKEAQVACQRRLVEQLCERDGQENKQSSRAAADDKMQPSNGGSNWTPVLSVADELDGRPREE